MPILRSKKNTLLSARRAVNPKKETVATATTATNTGLVMRSGRTIAVPKQTTAVLKQVCVSVSKQTPKVAVKPATPTVSKPPIVANNSACLMAPPLDIDKLVQNISLPSTWVWEGYRDKALAWMKHLAATDRRTLCNSTFFHNGPTAANGNAARVGSKEPAKDYESNALIIQLVYKRGTLKSKRVLDQTKIRNLLRQIQMAKTRFVVIPMSISIYMDSTDGQGHANMVIIDRYARQIERFEPHGKYDQGTVHKDVDSLMELVTRQYLPGYKYVHPLDYCPEVGPQIAAQNSKVSHINNSPQGYCQAISLLYLHLRICNPNMTREQVVKAIMKDGPEATHFRVARYARYIDVVLGSKQSKKK